MWFSDSGNYCKLRYCNYFHLQITKAHVTLHQYHLPPISTTNLVIGMLFQHEVYFGKNISCNDQNESNFDNTVNKTTGLYDLSTKILRFYHVFEIVYFSVFMFFWSCFSSISLDHAFHLYNYYMYYLDLLITAINKEDVTSKRI